jgi:2-polyprenyl-6-methoxyphenol hydroxylase-like FAD-dependent oxidoreductase
LTPTLRIACIGGGPGGLFTAIALSRTLPGCRVDVFERNSESDVFGFGVVFSDTTLDNVDAIDPVLRETLTDHGRRWDTIAVHSNGVTVAAGGNGMSAVHRRVLLQSLRRRATELGAHLVYDSPVTVDELDGIGYDLIVAADGTNSTVRQQFIGDLGHTADEARVKFIWFGTTHQFDGLTFLHERNEHGNFAVHGYPIGSGLSTFIVETDEPTWRRAGLDRFDVTQPAGPSDLATQRYLEDLFGHPLVANNSRWANFRTRRTRHWHTVSAQGTPVALLGDAVHTAHFSVGSGTKMAMEDAAALAQSMAERPADIPAALDRFEQIRRPQVAKVQNSAMPSLSWWDHFGEYQRSLAPWQFGFHFFSRAISAEKIRQRDPGFVADSERAWRDLHGAGPLETPLTVGGRILDRRLLAVETSTPEAVSLGDGCTSLRATADDTGDAVLVTAPDTVGTALDEATTTALDDICARRPAAVVIRGGSELTRVLCSEHVRLASGIPTIVVDQHASVRARRAVDEIDNAATLILSGRADAVTYEPEPAVVERELSHVEATR